MNKQPEVIILRETLWQSVLSDTYTFFMASALIGVGVALESSAMQWVGAILFMLAIVLKASNYGKRKAIAEARAFLDDLESRQ